MKKTLVIVGALLVSASVASAQTPGINLAWNDCGTFGASSTSFDCQTTSGTPFILVASFIPPTGVDLFVGVASELDISTDTALPAWWQHGVGFCRGSGALSVSFDFTDNVTWANCNDPYMGLSAGAFVYEMGYAGANQARIRCQAAIPLDNAGPLDPTKEYYAYRVSINRTKSSGTGACAGCATPACLSLHDVTLYQSNDVDPAISNPANGNTATWQVTSLPSQGCNGPTPTHNSSWGQVKSLYR